jgi:hypothetical protein
MTASCMSLLHGNLLLGERIIAVVQAPRQVVLQPGSARLLAQHTIHGKWSPYAPTRNAYTIDTDAKLYPHQSNNAGDAR